MQQLRTGMVVLLRPAPTERSDWTSCGREGEGGGDVRRRGLLLQQQGGVRKRKREEGRSRKLHRPDNLPLSPPSSTGSHSLPLRRHDSHAASAPRGVRAEGQRDHTVMSSSPLPAASHSASRIKGIRYQANHLPTAPHIKRLVTGFLSHNAVHSHSNWWQCHFNKTLKDVLVHVHTKCA